ncbi:hypothetical protein HYV89_04470 [Candidatus Woesearchaeota archaeon]|nr:hypothetical protein [Candidatus Woesearchaeota archaeon]
MKLKILIIIFICLLPIINADQGRTFNLDFNLHDQYDLFLKKSDRVLFEYGGYNNTIIIDEIKVNTTELDLFLFLEMGLHNPDYQFLGNGYDIRLDFNKDGKKEMSIRLVRNDLKNGVTNILFNRLDGWDEDAKLDLSSWKVENERTNNNVIWYFIGAVILMLMVIILLTYGLKRRGVYF